MNILVTDKSVIRFTVGVAVDRREVGPVFAEAVRETVLLIESTLEATFPEMRKVTVPAGGMLKVCATMSVVPEAAGHVLKVPTAEQLHDAPATKGPNQVSVV